MRQRIAIIISIFLHLCLLITLSINKSGGHGDKNGGFKQQIHPVSMKITDDKKNKEQKPKDGKILVKKIKIKKKEKTKEPDCKDFYIGIGVENDWGSCRITKVYEGYPAYQNGILPGDLVISPPCPQVVANKISRIDMVIMRGMKVLHLSFMRGKICGKK